MSSMSSVCWLFPRFCCCCSGFLPRCRAPFRCSAACSPPCYTCNPGCLAGRVAGLFSPHSRQGLEVIWDPGNAMVMAPAARWLFSFWSQLFSVWFNIGVLAAVSYLISFSDLAFAWSTTLNLDSAGFHRALQALSWPWHSVLPDAVPSPELIEISRYYRLEDGSLGASGAAPARAAQLGGWWPFLLAAIVCYGLLPRLLTLLVSWLRFRHHLSKALPRIVLGAGVARQDELTPGQYRSPAAGKAFQRRFERRQSAAGNGHRGDPLYRYRLVRRGWQGRRSASARGPFADDGH